MLTVICPRCDGTKSAFGVRCSDRGCQTGSWACDFCKGEGRAMRDARVKLGMTQREEANRLGIGWIQLNDIERRRLSLEQVSKRLD